MKKKKTAIWVLTPNGFKNALKIRDAFDEGTIFVSDSVEELSDAEQVRRFSGLKNEVNKVFREYSAHIFFMATGIVVRIIAGMLESKLTDPAVIVADDRGYNVISLVSGHVGEANRLTLDVAEILGANPVITTATDVNGLPAIDLFAVENNLKIENSEGIKYVNMAFLKGDDIPVYDPFGYMKDGFHHGIRSVRSPEKLKRGSVCIDYRVNDLPESVLILRPPLLSVGIGCNRGTPFQEIHDLFEALFAGNRLSLLSLKRIASIELKKDEAGILDMGKKLNLPVCFYNKEELAGVEGIQNPSALVEKHTGVKNVCEAAAIRASGNGKLIIPKTKTKNVTMAVAEGFL